MRCAVELTSRQKNSNPVYCIFEYKLGRQVHTLDRVTYLHIREIFMYTGVKIETSTFGRVCY